MGGINLIATYVGACFVANIKEELHGDNIHVNVAAHARLPLLVPLRLGWWLEDHARHRIHLHGMGGAEARMLSRVQTDAMRACMSVLVLGVN